MPRGESHAHISVPTVASPRAEQTRGPREARVVRGKGAGEGTAAGGAVPGPMPPADSLGASFFALLP